MKKLIFALPILFLAVSNNAYGEEIWSPYDFTTHEFLNHMDEVQVSLPIETERFYQIKNSFDTSSSFLTSLEELRPSVDVKIFRWKFNLVLTDDPGRIALQLQRSFN